ncbi:MAG: endonuclease [Pirellulaceae bacterium]
MFMDRFRQQIENAERRFRQHTQQREVRGREIAKIDRGDWNDVDMSLLDDASRIRRRLELAPEVSESVARTVAKAAGRRADARAVLLERIIETNELMSASFLIRGAQVRRSVGRVAIRGSSGGILGFGTGSMVSPRLMMTNNHVLDGSATAANSTIQFDFVERFDGTMMDIVEYALAPGEFFITDEALDVTIVAVALASEGGESLASRGWSPLLAESGKAVVGERVNIIQHPGGQPQQIALRQNRIVDVVDDFLHYAADTQQGSSGSAVANDVWQTAALHHAGVPNRDALGRILLIGGQPWDGSSNTVDQIHWIANEGVRISRIVDLLQQRSANMTPAQQALLEEAFTAPGESESLTQGVVGPGLPPFPTFPTATPAPLRFDQLGRVVYTVPVEIALGIPMGSPIPVAPIVQAGFPVAAQSAATSTTARPAPAMVGKPLGRVNEDDLQSARAALRAHEADDYYDADADAGDIDAYYAGIAERADLVGTLLFHALHKRLMETHTTVFSYSKARLEHLYPWVDLRPDGELKSIYSGEGFDAEEVIRRDLEVAAMRESLLGRFIKTEAAANPEAMEAFLENLEATAPFNCEHVVPQSWFNEKQPMKADLHHLFTCEPDCNSFRSNIPYFQFPPVEEIVRPKCGRRETDERRFEPAEGKGPVARATLYFLLRYLGLVGDEAREMQAERIPTLLKWHNDEPVTLYERHRNAAIHAVQGNRNPLIDFPEWAEFIDFGASFGI